MSTSISATRRMSVGTAAALVLAVLALVTAFSWHSTASADPYPPKLQCAVSSSGSVAPGASATIIGSGFGGVANVSLTLGGSSAGSVSTGSDGSFSTTVSVPSTASGTETIVASSGSNTCSADLSVKSSGVAAVSATKSSSGLASTGFAVITGSLIGFALLAGGIVFLAVGRRRNA